MAFYASMAAAALNHGVFFGIPHFMPPQRGAQIAEEVIEWNSPLALRL